MNTKQVLQSFEKTASYCLRELVRYDVRSLTLKPSETYLNALEWLEDPSSHDNATGAWGDFFVPFR